VCRRADIRRAEKELEAVRAQRLAMMIMGMRMGI
jgi:hypothetical protein